MDTVPFGKPRAERADAVRNRELLLETARALIAEQGADKVTMDGLAERAGLGKGTVFRRFGSRAGIFKALFDEDERRFQEQVFTGPPPLGPGADPTDRLVAYGRARIAFLMGHHAIFRATLDRASGHVPPGSPGVTQIHIRMLLGLARVPVPNLTALSIQLSAALEGPILLYLAMPEAEIPPAPDANRFLGDSWQALIERIAR